MATMFGDLASYEKLVSRAVFVLRPRRHYPPRSLCVQVCYLTCNIYIQKSVEVASESRVDILKRV